jgi:hypothetical protein
VLVALGIGVQFSPDGSHRSHCWVVAGVGTPLHVPSPAVKARPTEGVPVTVGRERSCGAVGHGLVFAETLARLDRNPDRRADTLRRYDV